jgi:Putative MetA-pathway of phenol degradation
MKRWNNLAACLVATAVSPAAAQSLPVPSMNIPEASSKRGFDWGFSTGVDYVTGAKCRLQSSSISCISTGSTAFSIPSTVMAQFNRVRLEVTVPFVDIEGPGSISGVLGTPQITGTSNAADKRRFGLGDVSVGAAVILLRDGPILPRVEIGGVVKTPTGVNGLGTGKTDYGAQMSLYHPLWSDAAIFGSAGYQWIGDPNTVDLHKGARGTAGIDMNYGILGGGALLDYSQSLLPGLANAFTVDPYITLRVLGSVGFQVYTAIGLTPSSPSQEVGFRVVFGNRIEQQ